MGRGRFFGFLALTNIAMFALAGCCCVCGEPQPAPRAKRSHKTKAKRVAKKPTKTKSKKVRTDLVTVVPSGTTVAVPSSSVASLCAQSRVPRSGFSISYRIVDGRLQDSSRYAEVSRELSRDLRLLASEAGIVRDAVPPVFAANVPNAAAVTVLRRHGVLRPGQRLILYNPSYVRSAMRRSGDRDALSFVFAHELGHHVHGHTGHRPGESQHKLELEADRYAGFVMGHRGRSLSATLSWVRANVPTRGSRTHPSRSRRERAARAGWKDGCAEGGKCKAKRKKKTKRKSRRRS